MAHYGFTPEGKEIKSQWICILTHLQTTGERITSWQAIKDFGFTRLAAIVKEIEKRTGICLERQNIEVKTRYGGTTWITEYWYED